MDALRNAGRKAAQRFRLASGAAGFTLIEVLIALSVLVIAVVPLTGVIWAGLKAQSTSNHRTEAFSLAAGEIESMHADPYALVGFYADQGAPSWKGTTTVIVGACAHTCAARPFAPLILPRGTALVAGVQYSIDRYVYWAGTQGPVGSSSATSYFQAYKATTVMVVWADASGSHSVEQDSVIYPGGLGVYSGPGGSSPPTTSTTVPAEYPATPGLALAATQPAAPLDQSEVDLAISAPVGGGPVGVYYVQWDTDSTFASPSQSPQLPPSSTFYAAQGLAAGTTYYFRIFAANGGGQSFYSAPAVSATTAAAPVTTTTVGVPSTTTPPTSVAPSTTTTTRPCNLGAFTVTTATTGKTYLQKGNAKMSEDLVLNLAVNGACTSSITVTAVLHGTTSPDPGTPYVLAGPAPGGVWSDAVATANQKGWSLGTHDFTVSVNGTATAISRGLLVCAWNANPSPLSTVC